MTLYNQLVKSIRLGLFPIVIDSEGLDTIVFYSKHNCDDDDLLSTSWVRKITNENFFNETELFEKVEIDDMEKRGCKITGFYNFRDNPDAKYETGDKVRHVNGIDRDLVYTITEFNPNTELYTGENGKSILWFHAKSLVPCFEEDSKRTLEDILESLPEEDIEIIHEAIKKAL